MAIVDLANTGIQKLKPYTPGKSEADLQRELGLTDVVKLASNENPLGPSELVMQAVSDALTDGNRYPDGAAIELRNTIKQLHASELNASANIETDQITFGNGSSEILELALRVFVTDANEVMFSDHAFALYPLLTQALGANANIIPALPADHAMPFGHDLAGFLQAINSKTRLIFIANPNNPTGTWLVKEDLYAFLKQVPDNILVVLDEAYFDYAKALQTDYPDGVEWVNEFPNLIVTRTFSKAYGLASFRVGYGVSSAEIADLMNRIRPPFNVNMYAQAAAIAAINDKQHMQKALAVNNTGLDAIKQYCDNKGLHYLPSAANFISIDFKKDAADINQALLEQGVIVRSNHGYGLPTTLRVSIGTQEENQKFLSALDKLID